MYGLWIRGTIKQAWKVFASKPSALNSVSLSILSIDKASRRSFNLPQTSYIQKVLDYQRRAGKNIIFH